MAPSDHDTPQHAPQISAGGVVYERTAAGVRVCLIAKHAGRVWSLPKGRLDDGETPEAAAVREVLEETGHRVRIVDTLGRIEYEFHWKTNNTHYHKVVTFFLMALMERDAQAPDHEADAVEWVGLDDALSRVTHENEREILRRAQRKLQEHHE